MEAQEQHRNLVSANWHSMNKQTRKDVHRDIHKKAYPSIFSEKKTLKGLDLMRALNG